MGGLGLKRIEDINRALLAKWLWHIGESEDKLWKRIVWARYKRSRDVWLTKMPANRYGVSLWRDICNCVGVYGQGVQFEVGRGDNVLFWQHKWVGREALKNKFPLLYDVCREKSATVGCFLTQQAHGRAWNLNLARRLTDNEVQQTAQLMPMLEEVQFNGESEDVRGWCSKMQYSVTATARMLTEVRTESLGPRNDSVETSLIWLKKVPSRINFFVWVLAKDMVLTHENLMRRGYHLCSNCVFCEQEVETRNHLFLSCPVIMEIWDFIFGVFGVHKPSSWTMESILALDTDEHFTEIGQVYWRFIRHATFWEIWFERNNCIFEETKLESWRLIDKIKKSIWRWGLSVEETKNITIENVMFSIGKLARIM